MGRGLKGRLAVQGTVGANGSHAARVLDQGNRKAVDQPVSELHLFRGAGGVGLDGEGVERGPSGGAEDPVGGDGDGKYGLVDLRVVGSLLSLGGADDGVDDFVGGKAAEHADVLDNGVNGAVVDVVPG